MQSIDLFDLTGRTAIVTGGSRGLGRQIAEALGAAGAELMITARKAAELEQTVAELAALGFSVHGLATDHSQPTAIEAFAEQALRQLGHVDILVNNAGTAWGAPAEEHPLSAWQKLIDLNLTGTFVLCQQIARLSMIPRRYGRILNIASIAGLRGNIPGTNETIAYNTTKGGLVNFTRALAAEWGEHNITVNALAPGYFPSKMTRSTIDRFGDQIKARAPLQRLGDEHDLQGASLLFCSDAGKHISGQILAIDGGATAV